MAEVAPGASKIFVRYRNTKPSVDQMREIFSKHGTITDVKLYAKFCFIEYDSEEAAETAVAAENGTVFKGVKLEVETVVRNVQKRKPDETVDEAVTSTKVAVSKSEEVPSADCAVKKLKQDILTVDVLTKDSSATETTEVKASIVPETTEVKATIVPETTKVKTTIASETTKVKTTIASETTKVKTTIASKMLENASKSIEAPRRELNLPQSRRTRNRQRNRPQGSQHVNVICVADEKVLQQQSFSPKIPEYHTKKSKSKERYVAICAELQTRPEDKLSSDHALRSSSASLSHSDQPLNSYGPIPAYPDYAPKSLPTAHSQQPSSTTYGWSGWSAEQTYTTAYPHADSQSYSSNYAAECSQVNACRPGTSFYGSHERTDVHSLNQADKSRLTQSVQPWNDAQMIHEGYSKEGYPSGLGKGDRPHLPDVVNYPSVHTVAKSSTSDLKPRESRDIGYLPAEQTYTTSYPRADSRSYSSNYTAENSQVNASRPETSFYGSHEKTDVRNQESSVESGKISMSRGTTSSAQVVSSTAEYQGQERSDSAIEQSGMCELIITEPNLRQYGLKVASKIHSVGLKVEICNLPPGMTIIEEVEDALIRGILFAVIITERHVEHNSVTVDVLHGVAEEHRNMVLDDAVRLIASSYQDYMAAKRADAKSSAVSTGPTKSKADVVLDERTQMLIKGLAQNQHLTYEELEEIIIYLKKRQEVLRKESNVLGSLSGQSTAPKQQVDSVDVKLQKKLEATIFSILKGESPVQQQATSAKPKHSGSYASAGHYVDSGVPYVSNDYRRY